MVAERGCAAAVSADGTKKKRLARKQLLATSVAEKKMGRRRCWGKRAASVLGQKGGVGIGQKGR